MPPPPSSPLLPDSGSGEIPPYVNQLIFSFNHTIEGQKAEIARIEKQSQENSKLLFQLRDRIIELEYSIRNVETSIASFEKQMGSLEDRLEQAQADQALLEREQNKKLTELVVKVSFIVGGIGLMIPIVLSKILG